MNTSKTARLATALRSGDELTARQIASRFSVANPHDLVYRLRERGFNIKMNTKENSKGQTVRRYTMANTRGKKN